MTEASISGNIPELPPEPPRESLIATAVKFLQNAKVQQSPLEQKKQFLVKKGLTDEEIVLALARSGVNTNAAIAPTITPITAIVPPLTPEISVWARIREYSTLAILIGGVVYGLFALYKRFIEPMFSRHSKEQEDKLSKLKEQIQSANQGNDRNMEEIRSFMNDMQTQLGQQSMKLGQVAANLTSYKSETSTGNVTNSAVSELKAEITSIKGLLLGRNQFPSKPLPPPVIPSWQMKPVASSPDPSIDDAVSNQEDVGNDQKLIESDSRHKDVIESCEDGSPGIKTDGLYSDDAHHMNGHVSDSPESPDIKLNGNDDISHSDQ